jgi:Bacterial toxin 47
MKTKLRSFFRRQWIKIGVFLFSLYPFLDFSASLYDIWLTKQVIDSQEASYAQKLAAIVATSVGMTVPFAGYTKPTLETVKLVEKTAVLQPLKYKLQANDLDLRGQNIQFEEALQMAFEKTGVKREDFVPTKWAKTKEGKSRPVEYKAKNGGSAKVNLDFAHENGGLSPDAPHIGWQNQGKGTQKARGHIILDEVPAWRSNNKADYNQH